MSFLRSILSTLTVRKVAIMLALSFSLPLLGLILAGTRIPFANAVAYAFSALVNLLIVLAADEWAKRGRRVRQVTAIAVLATLLSNCAIGALAQYYFGDQFGRPPLAATMHWTQVLRFGINESLWGVFALFVYLNRRIAERMLQSIRESELRRVRLETQLVESRLTATQAQVEPQLLFSELAEIRSKLSAGLPDADEQLDGLIRHLRSALARTVVSSEM
jgi:hypothetical protein